MRIWRKTIVLCIFALLSAVGAAGQEVKLLAPRSMGKWGIRAGNYSGITPLGGGRYAVVDDKYPYEGFFVFRIVQDSVTGQVIRVTDEGFCGGSRRMGKGWDAEGIAYRAADSTVWISRESDQRILAYTTDGQSTGNELSVPDGMKLGAIVPNYGFEALAYDTCRGKFWTMTENVLKADGKPLSPESQAPACLRLQSFGADGQPGAQYAYRTGLPLVKRRGRTYAFGVVALWAQADGSLWVMEREIDVARRILKSKTHIHIYKVAPADSDVLADNCTPERMEEKALEKQLIVSFSTRMRLFRPKFANYEGICEGAKLADGRHTMLLVADSQNRYGNRLCHLRDLIRVLVIR